MRNHLQEIKKEILKNLSELISGFFVLIIMLILVALALGGYVENILQHTTIAIVGSGIIIMIGFEKRAKKFEKYVALVAVFLLSISFMFL